MDNSDELRYVDEVLDVLDDHLEGLFKVWKDSVEFPMKDCRHCG